LLSYVRGQNEVAIACAWSGIAATLLEGGKTCHSVFGFPVPAPTENVPSRIRAQSGKAEVLRQAQLIIWDEAPMSPSEAVDGADALLRDLVENDAHFGGKVVFFAGDFRQVLPVMPRAGREEVVAHSLRNHRFWTDKIVNIHKLSGNARAREDMEYASYLLRLGDGEEEVHEHIGPNAVRLPDRVAAPETWGLHDLVAHTFPDLVAMALRCAAPIHPRRYGC
jgi:hypothetical protein